MLPLLLTFAQPEEPLSLERQLAIQAEHAMHAVQDSEAPGDMSFAEYKRQRRAEQDDAEYPDEVGCKCL